ncbi:MAG: hypothetical protein AB1486_21365 [Planctomycetota bacterium]
MPLLTGPAVFVASSLNAWAQCGSEETVTARDAAHGDAGVPGCARYDHRPSQIHYFDGAH